MKHLDLFSGIGGFALAAEWVWPEVEHTFCEIDPFCQAVLQKHWNDSKIYGDIRTLTADAEHARYVATTRGYCGEESGSGRAQEQASTLESSRGNTSPFLLTGGFPCQPFSQAGRRRGTEDDRHLWPEMLRVIREFHPRWVVGENVGGFVTWNDGMVLEQVHTDLEGEGYEVQSFIIPAVSVNAPHRRDRVWIVAHASSDGDCGGSTKIRKTNERKSGTHRSLEGLPECGESNSGNASDTKKRGWGEGHTQRGRVPQGKRTMGSQEWGGFANNDVWKQNWTEVAAQLCTLDDGLPKGLARPRGWRNAALKGAGNAIVPQVAAEIFRAIKATDE